MKNLGWMNDWTPNSTPKEFVECQRLNHKTNSVQANSYTKEFCEACGIYWEIDSSD
jgi:hypothetical protein